LIPNQNKENFKDW